MDNDRQDTDWSSILKCFSLTGYLGFLMVASILGGFLIGWLADKFLGTGIIFTIIFIIVGIAGGFISVYREISKRIQ